MFGKTALVLLMVLSANATLCLAIEKKDLKIKVYSGDGNLASAEKTAADLRNVGYSIGVVDHALRSDFIQTTVFYTREHEKNAAALASAVDSGKVSIQPLSWPSDFDLVIVTGSPAAAETFSDDKGPKEIKTEKKKLSPLNEKAEQVKKDLYSALDEAHRLYQNADYISARERYNDFKDLISKASDLCRPPVGKPQSDPGKMLKIQVLGKDKDLSSTRPIIEKLSGIDLEVSSVDYALRSDLVENALYYGPGLEAMAGNIAGKTNQTFSLLPIQWISDYDLILVTSRPVSEDIQIMDVNQKMQELRNQENGLQGKIELLIAEAFELLGDPEKCSAAQNKFKEIKTYSALIKSLCETASRLSVPQQPSASARETGGSKITDETGTVLNLDEAIKTAILNNPTIKEAREKIYSAYAQKMSAFSDFLPRAAFSYNYTRLNEAPSITLPEGIPFFPAGEIAMGTENNFTWNLTLSQPVFTGFGLLSQYELKKLNIETTEFQKKTDLLNLVRDVRRAYFNLLLSGKVRLVTEETVVNLQSHENDAEQFYTQGMIPYNDLLKAKVALANAVQENERAGAVYKIAEAALNILLNQDVNRKIMPEDIFMISWVSFQLSDLLHEAVENRPELVLINLAVKQMDQAIRGVKSAYYPQVSVIGRYQQTGDNISATENDFGEVDSATLSLQADWSLFKGGKTRHETARYRHDKIALMKQYESAENGIQLEIKNVYENLLVSEKNIVTAQESLAQAEENWRITTLQYKEQIATSTDVLDARTFLSQAELNYYRALYGYMMSIADLDRAVGKPYPPFIQ